MRTLLVILVLLAPSTALAHDPNGAIAEAIAIAQEAHDDAEKANALRREAVAQRDDAVAQRNTCFAHRDTARTERDNCAGELAARQTDVLRLNERAAALSEENTRLAIAVKRLQRSRIILALVGAGAGLAVGAGVMTVATLR